MADTEMANRQALCGYMEAHENEHVQSGGRMLRESGPFDERTPRRCTDAVWGLLFIILVVAMAVFAFVSTDGFSFKDISKEDRDRVPMGAISMALLVSLLVAIGISFVTFSLTRHCTKIVVWASLLFSPVMMIVAGLVLVSVGGSGLIIGGIMIALGVCTLSCIFCCWRRYVEYTIAILKPVSEVLGDHCMGVAVVGLSGGLACFVYMILASGVIVGVYSKYDFCQANQHCGDQQNTAYAVFFVCAVVLYWGGQVFMNTCHCVYCGILGRWYFNKVPSVGASIGAAMKSFGSICLGSLIVAIIKAAEALVRQMRERNRSEDGVVAIIKCVALCVLECIISCVRDIAEFLSYMAYVQVAVRGYTFFESVRVTFALCTFRNMKIILGSSLVGNVVTLASLFAGCFGGLAAALMVYNHQSSLNSTKEEAQTIASIAFALGMLIGLFGSEMILYSLRSGFATVAICWAEDQDALEGRGGSARELHQQFKNKLGGAEAMIVES